MSSFLSNKFLQRRNAPERQPAIDEDFFCGMCGYNLRGLSFGRNCPECGQPIRRTTGLNDALTSGDPTRKKRIRLGLTLAAGCLVVAAIARLWLFIALIFLGWPPAQDIYLWMGMTLCGVWIVGVFLLTLRDMDALYRSLRWLRLTARWSQVIWIPAYALWMMASLGPAAGTPQGDTLYSWSVLLRGIGGVGAMIFAAWLIQLAVDAELEESARWLNLSVWMLPIPTLLLANLPSQMPWIFLVLIGMVLLVWCWFVFLMGRAVWVMQRHMSWSLRLGRDALGRDARMAQMRNQLQHAVDAQVRPVDGPSVVMTSVSTEVDRWCSGCGYNLRGLRAGARCPECGQRQ